MSQLSDVDVKASYVTRHEYYGQNESSMLREFSANEGQRDERGRACVVNVLRELD